MGLHTICIFIICCCWAIYRTHAQPPAGGTAENALRTFPSRKPSINSHSGPPPTGTTGIDHTTTKRASGRRNGGNEHVAVSLQKTQQHQHQYRRHNQPSPPQESLQYYYDYVYIHPTSVPTARPSPRPTSTPTAYPTPRPNQRPRRPTPPPQVRPLNISSGGAVGLAMAAIAYAATVGVTLYIYYYYKKHHDDEDPLEKDILRYDPPSKASKQQGRQSEDEEEALQPRPSWGEEMTSFFRKNPFQRPSFAVRSVGSERSTDSSFSVRDSSIDSLSNSNSIGKKGGFGRSLYRTVFGGKVQQNRQPSQPLDSPLRSPNNNSNAHDKNNSEGNDKYAKWGRRILQQNPFKSADSGTVDSSSGSSSAVPYYRESLTKGTQAL